MVDVHVRIFPKYRQHFYTIELIFTYHDIKYAPKISWPFLRHCTLQTLTIYSIFQHRSLEGNPKVSEFVYHNFFASQPEPQHLNFSPPLLKICFFIWKPGLSWTGASKFLRKSQLAATNATKRSGSKIVQAPRAPRAIGSASEGVPPRELDDDSNVLLATKNPSPTKKETPPFLGTIIISYFLFEENWGFGEAPGNYCNISLCGEENHRLIGVPSVGDTLVPGRVSTQKVTMPPLFLEKWWTIMSFNEPEETPVSITFISMKKDCLPLVIVQKSFHWNDVA